MGAAPTAAAGPVPLWRPIAPDLLVRELASWLTGVADRRSTARPVLRVAVDGAEATRPVELVDALVEALRSSGVAAARVREQDFWRDASLRLEHGRDDARSRPQWLDADAMSREVLLRAATEGSYLPTLRDACTNRSTREPVRPLEPGSVLLVGGAFLLGAGLPFDRSVHLTASPAALHRRTPPELRWALPAYDDYDRQVGPTRVADVVVKVEDALRPAVRGLP